MRLFIGADHAGFGLKEKIKKYLDKKGIVYEDMGVHTLNPKDDYPDIAFLVAEKVAKHKNGRGILICGSGIGMTIAANKVRGIRAVAATDTFTATVAREDNDANIIGLRGRRFSAQKAKEIIDIWLTTPFSGIPRHKRRLRKIVARER